MPQSYLLLNSAFGYIHLIFVQDGSVVWNEQQPSNKETDRLIFHQIDHALKQSNLNLEDFDYYAVVQGPGSYAGIRIGFSVIKTFAMIFQKPLIGLHSLDLLASHYQETSFDVLLNCARAEVFHATYERQHHQIIATTNAHMTTIDQLPDDFFKKPVAFYRIPSTSKRFDALFEALQILTPHQKMTCHQPLVMLAQQNYEKAKLEGFPEVQPIYLKKEVDWSK